MLSIMTEATYTVTGMSCGHCARSITAELLELPGVRDVSVDVPAGRVIVTSEAPMAGTEVRAAVEEAGFHLAALVS